MTIVQPAQTRYTVENLSGTQRFIIPSRKVWYVIIVFGILLAFWIAAGIRLFTEMLGDFLNDALTPDVSTTTQALDITLLVVMLLLTVVWLISALFMAQIFLWHIAGKEIVEVSPQSIGIRFQISALGRSRVYLAEHIKNLRLSPSYAEIGHPFWPDLSGFNLIHNRLAFDYGAKTIRFARGLEEAEAKQLLKAIEGALGN